MRLVCRAGHAGMHMQETAQFSPVAEQLLAALQRFGISKNYENQGDYSWRHAGA